MALKVKYPGEFEFKYDSVLGDESGGHVGTFGEITLDKKISRFFPFNAVGCREQFGPYACSFLLFALPADSFYLLFWLTMRSVC
jgi:hypothetical protein